MHGSLGPPVCLQAASQIGSAFFAGLTVVISTRTHKTDHTILSVAIDHMCANNVNCQWIHFLTSQTIHLQLVKVVANKQPVWFRLSCVISLRISTWPMVPEATHTCFNSHFTGTTRVSQYQKGKTNVDFTEARVVVASAGPFISKSAPCSRQITTPPSHHSTGQIPSCRPTNSVKSLKAMVPEGRTSSAHQ